MVLIFDHADIYGGGKSEEVFADAIDMNATIREKWFFNQNAEFVKDSLIFQKSTLLLLWKVAWNAWKQII